MKKIYGIIVLLVIIFILPIKTFAVDYTIDEMDIMLSSKKMVMFLSLKIKRIHLKVNLMGLQEY